MCSPSSICSLNFRMTMTSTISCMGSRQPCSCPEMRIIIRDKTPLGEHPGRFNAPTTNEVAVIMSGTEHSRRVIIISQQDGQLHHIEDPHCAIWCTAISVHILEWSRLLLLGSASPWHNFTSCHLNFPRFQGMVHNVMWNSLWTCTLR